MPPTPIRHRSELRIAFYAPLKAPDHPVPSGDRQMARLLLLAIAAGGHAASGVSELRSFAAEPSAAKLDAVMAAARQEIERLGAVWTATPALRPDLWFTYHPFYKAPDLLGPALARRFGLPYVTAEASHAAKRAQGPWAAWHAAHTAGLIEADLHFCFTDRDREGLAGIVDKRRLRLLPPFIAEPARPAPQARRDPAVVELVTVAMMRPGDKSRSYAFLVEALACLPRSPEWRLTIIGDGPAREAVQAMVSGLPPESLRWRGEVPPERVADHLAEADLYVWPGFGEAYGLAYLEAAAMGLPVLAQDCGGIASVVLHERTGLLVPEGRLDAFVEALKRLIADAPLRRHLGRGALRLARQERTVAQAAVILSQGFETACRTSSMRGAG